MSANAVSATVVSTAACPFCHDPDCWMDCPAATDDPDNPFNPTSRRARPGSLDAMLAALPPAQDKPTRGRGRGRGRRR